MTAADTLAIQQTAARAALSVPGVAELQPSLGQRLAGAATWVRRTARHPTPSATGGIRADRTSAPSGWHIEVRCVLQGDHRALDVARDVHDQVRAAITSHITRHGSPGPVDVVVTVTRIAAPGLHPAEPDRS